MNKIHDEQNIHILEETAPDRAEFGEGGESAKCRVGKLPAAYRGKGEAQERLEVGWAEQLPLISSVPSLPSVISNWGFIFFHEFG